MLYFPTKFITPVTILKANIHGNPGKHAKPGEALCGVDAVAAYDKMLNFIANANSLTRRDVLKASFDCHNLLCSPFDHIFSCSKALDKRDFSCTRSLSMLAQKKPDGLNL